MVTTYGHKAWLNYMTATHVYFTCLHYSCTQNIATLYDENMAKRMATLLVYIKQCHTL